MAKELPYFRFEVGEWQNGNIGMCQASAKALFVDMLCLYWSRLGDLPVKLAQNRLQTDGFDELLEYEIIKIDGENIIIEFLDEQLNDIIELRNKRIEAGRIGGLAKAKASAKQMLQQNPSKSLANKIDNKIINNNKKDIIEKRFTPPTIHAVERYMDEKGLHDAQTESEKFVDYYTNKDWKIGSSRTKMKDWQAAVRNWIKNIKTDGRKQISQAAKTIDQSKFL